MFTVVTSFSPAGYEEYGRGFVETFKQFWPKEVFLICAWEGPSPGPLNGFDLLKTEPCQSFLYRHSCNQMVRGRREAYPAIWSPKAKAQGYSFRHDAYKFARKVFAICQAARFVEGGKLFWIDADVRCHRPMPLEFLDKLLPDEVCLSYLSREHFKVHSELGFVGYNLDRLETLAFLTAYERQYAEDRFLHDPTGWDDCNQFDRLVFQARPAVKTIAHNSRGQPFDSSVLGRYMTHNKGRKKEAA